MDNLSVHRSKKVREEMEKLDMIPIYNASYSPDYNPIEGVIGLAKNHIKRERLRAIVLGTKLDLN